MIGIDLRKYKTLDLSFYLALEEYLTTIKQDEDYFFLWDIDKSIIGESKYHDKNLLYGPANRVLVTFFDSFEFHGKNWIGLGDNHI